MWANCRLRIFALQPSGDQGEPLQNELRQALNDVRISADVIETVHVECTAAELGSFFGGKYLGLRHELPRESSVSLSCSVIDCRLPPAPRMHYSQLKRGTWAMASDLGVRDATAR